jgi:hypothetical protein
MKCSATGVVRRPRAAEGRPLAGLKDVEKLFTANLTSTEGDPRCRRRRVDTRAPGLTTGDHRVPPTGVQSPSESSTDQLICFIWSRL